MINTKSQLFLFLFLLFITPVVFCQKNLTGIILDENSHKPIGYASVYISGTTIGTYTDSKGCFTLNNVPTSCQIVVSHVAYNVQMKPIDESTPDKLAIYIKEKTRQLNEVKVADKSRRAANIKTFRQAFLGDDYWGKNAILKNDSVLTFSYHTDTTLRKADSTDFIKQRKYKSVGQNSKWSSDSAFITTTTQVFAVRSKTPLMIELPLLGYTVFVDLIDFSLKTYKNWTDYYSWAYYRFSAYSGISSRQQSKFEKNRENAYYNSMKHFCQSLFFDRLRENGYLLAALTYNDSTKRNEQTFVDIKSHLHYNESKELCITGLKDKKLSIYYFERVNGKPIDLTISSRIEGNNNIWEKFRTGYNPENNSFVLFQSDTCNIRHNGSIPHNSNILFGGKFGSKRAGALLPNNFVPKEMIENSEYQ